MLLSSFSETPFPPLMHPTMQCTGWPGPGLFSTGLGHGLPSARNLPSYGPGPIRPCSCQPPLGQQTPQRLSLLAQQHPSPFFWGL